MTIDDDGNKAVITSRAGFFVKLFSVVFLGMAVLFPCILVLSLVLPPQKAKIDCDRARATCVFTRAKWSRTAPVADVAAASLVYDKGARNRSSSHFVRIKLASGEGFDVSDWGYSASTTAEMKAAVDGLNGFLAEGSRQTFATEFISADTDWSALVWFTVISPLVGWLFFRLWGTRRVELDRAAQTATVVFKGVLRKEQRSEVPFSDLRGISGWGVRWIRFSFVTGSQGTMNLFLVPRTSHWLAESKRALLLMRSITSAPLQGEAARIVA